MAVTHGRLPHLFKRGGVWYFRRRVPLDLQRNLRRSEVVRSLRTPSLAEARGRAVYVNARMQRLLDRVRECRAMETEELIRTLCGRFLQERLAVDREDRRRAGPGVQIEGQALEYRADLEEESWRMREGDRSEVVPHARRLLAEAGQGLKGGDFDRLCHELQRTLLQAYRQGADEWAGDFAGRRRADEGPDRGSSAAGGRAGAASGQQRLLSEVITTFVSKKQGRDWAEKTASQIGKELARFLEIAGDKRIVDVSKEEILRYRQTLERLPARMGTYFPGQSVAQVLARNSDKPRMAPASIDKALSHVHNLFAFAETMEWFENGRNPVTGMNVSGKKNTKRAARTALTDEDIATIFNEGYRSATEGAGRTDRFWIPLLCLYTGARLNEMAQLQVSDVVTEQGIPAISINEEDEGKSVKTGAAQRIVPIHTQLAGLGFHEFIERSREAGNERLFPMLNRTSNGYGGAISSWYGRWRRRAGVNDSRKVFHSLRNTVITRLKAADVQEATIAEIVGHENENITTGRYGGKLEMPKLAEAIEKLDLRHPLSALF